MKSKYITVMGHEVKIRDILYKSIKSVLIKINKKRLDINAVRRIKRLNKTKKIRKTDVIKVCFISQMAEVWDKQAIVFETMLSDERFDPVILCIPPFDFVNKKVQNIIGDDYEFLRMKYGTKYVIDYTLEKNLDFESYDYVFLDRPYNHYLPKNCRSNVLSKKTRVCEVNYCTADWNGGIQYDFAVDVSKWFASNDVEYNRYLKANLISTPLRRVYKVGYPAFEYYSGIRRKEGNIHTILWTPRWSYDEGFGGSHFFEYIEQIIQFVQAHNDIRLVIRPHPLMFDNFKALGLMTEQQIMTLKTKCNSVGILFDENKIIKDTFEYSDILLADYSSIISLFILSGKPIIYCPMKIPTNSIFQRVCEGCYVEDNWSAIENRLKSLIYGNDELYHQRTEVIKEVFGDTSGITKKILDILFLEGK